jgi:hypothetical protein
MILDNARRTREAIATGYDEEQRTCLSKNVSNKTTFIKEKFEPSRFDHCQVFLSGFQLVPGQIFIEGGK